MVLISCVFCFASLWVHHAGELTVPGSPVSGLTAASFTPSPSLNRLLKMTSPSEMSVMVWSSQRARLQSMNAHGLKASDVGLAAGATVAGVLAAIVVTADTMPCRTECELLLLIEDVQAWRHPV